MMDFWYDNTLRPEKNVWYFQMQFLKKDDCILIQISLKLISRVPTDNKSVLTRWGRVTHICVGTLTIIGSDNGLSPSRRQAIIWTNAGLLLNGPLGTNFSEILIRIQTFSFKKMHLKMSSAKWRPFCRGLNVLNHWLRKWLGTKQS